MTRLLILGGTAEAAALAAAALARFGPPLEVITSLAGRTSEPRALEGEVRVGGFGGSSGLAGYLRDEQIDLLIDATHPFATEISKNAAEACNMASVARLAIVRPAWKAGAADDWRYVQNTAEAARAIDETGAARVFLSTGSRGLADFAALRDVFFLLRMIDAPKEPIPLANHRLVLGRGPFALEDEIALIKGARIELLVTRASGGEANEAKLFAARALELPVLLVERPVPPPGARVETVEAALDWIAARSQDV